MVIYYLLASIRDILLETALPTINRGGNQKTTGQRLKIMSLSNNFAFSAHSRKNVSRTVPGFCTTWNII